MATFTYGKLSQSTNGKQIKVVATATAGTLIHTACSGTTNWDEIYIYAVNSSSVDVKLTIEWGEATAPDGNIEVTISGESGLVLVIPGLPLQNSLEVRAFASAANVIMLSGYIHTVAP